MTSTPQYIKSSVIINKIAELEDARMTADSNQMKEMLEWQIDILKEILKPQ